MRIFTEQALKEYAENHPDSKVALQEWTTIVKRSKWTCFADIKKTFNSVDNVGNQHYVFNIKGNNYRLVVVIKFTIQFVYIRFIGTHKEYDKIDLQIKKQIVDGINRVYWKLGLRASSEFIEAWKEEVHEKLPVTWQHMIDLSQEVVESRQRKSIKELREEADKLLGKSNKRKSRDFEQDHDWEM